MKYTIMHINDRAKKLIDENKTILSSFKYVDSIPFFNGLNSNPWDELAARNINVSSWSPYDGRTSDPLPGELGIWISYLNVFDYILQTKTEQMLVLEDDAILIDSAVSSINSLMTDLPQSWDFLSLHYHSEQNQLTLESNIESDKIHKSINQMASTVAIVYSYSFAKKFLDLVQTKGIEYTIDCFLYRQSLLGLINGYSVIPSNNKIVNHNFATFKSTIDPENIRNIDVDLKK